MQKTNEIRARTDISLEETWNLADLFKDFEDWENSFNKLITEEALEKKVVRNFKNKLSTSANILFQCLEYRDNLFRKIENLHVYAGLRNAEDVGNKLSNEALGKIDNKRAALTAKFAFVEPEILTITNIKEWLKKDPLKQYSYQISELFRSKPHILSEREESILSRLSSTLQIFDDIHEKWNNLDLKFANALDSRNKEHIVTNSRYSLNLQSQDRMLRKNTFHSYYSEISKWRNTITSNYYGNMNAGCNLAKIRKFPSYLEASLFNDNIPLSLYDNLIKSVQTNLPLLHNSMKLRKKILNLDTVFPYDKSVSLYESSNEPRFTWEEGRDLVLNAISILGSEYTDIARKGLTTERWLDRAENLGKRSGAFSWGTFDSNPYMLQTWTGTLSDVYTLAHELGHSMHTYYSNKNQPYQNAGYSIFVAEVASTLNEALLSHYLLNQKSDHVLTKYILSENIENFEGTVLRQVLFATFEKEVAKLVDDEKTFTPDELEEIYFNLNKEWYGDESCSYPEFIKHEWMRIPHFYSPFYVYKYATSYCASLSLAEKLIHEDKAQTQKQIFTLLKAGGSKPPLEILNNSGVNLLTPAPISNAFLNYKRNLELAETTLVANKKATH